MRLALRNVGINSKPNMESTPSPFIAVKVSASVVTSVILICCVTDITTEAGTSTAIKGDGVNLMVGYELIPISLRASRTVNDELRHPHVQAKCEITDGIVTGFEAVG